MQQSLLYRCFGIMSCIHDFHNYLRKRMLCNVNLEAVKILNSERLDIDLWNDNVT